MPKRREKEPDRDKIETNLIVLIFFRSNFSSPLVDGMIVSRRSLGPLVRQTALNVSTRKRLEQENYQPSHVRRKLKIQELAARYRCQLSTSEFYANLV